MTRADWWNDASRTSAYGFCQAKRYLDYHAGPEGLGLILKAKAVPLVTGSHVHLGMALLMEAIKGGVSLPEVLWGLWKERSEEVAASYRDEVKEWRTKAGATPLNVKEVVEEQVCLVKALVYGWIRTSAKEFISNWEVLHFEKEWAIELPWKYSKTIRLLRGVKPDVVVRARRDFKTGNDILVRKGQVATVDWKTLSSYSESWMEEWLDSPQQVINCWATEQTLGEKVAGFMIYGLDKGRRKGSYNKVEKNYSGPDKQESFLCYAWMKPEVEAMHDRDFKPKGKWQEVGDDGEVHWRSLGKAYPDKVPVWEYMDPGEWVKLIDPRFLSELYTEAGLYTVEPYKVQQYLRSISAGEEEFLEKLRKVDQAEDELGWTSLKFHEKLDRILPRTYNCHRDFGNRCAQYQNCFKHPGWQTFDSYEDREPHYELEKKVLGLAEEEEGAESGS